MRPRRGDDATSSGLSDKASSSPRRALQNVSPALAENSAPHAPETISPARADREGVSQFQQTPGQEDPQQAQLDQPSSSLWNTIADRLSRFFKSRPIQVFWRVIQALIVVSAAGILVATFFISVLQVRGTSMEPTVKEGDVVIADHSNKFATGDVIAFYYNNKVILKRVIAFPTDWVDIKPDGTVWVNGEELQEDYVQGLSLGHPDIIFPYQVPEGRYFVLGDHRSASIDSRSSTIGTVSDDQVIGSVFLKVWPLKNLGTVR